MAYLPLHTNITPGRNLHAASDPRRFSRCCHLDCSYNLKLPANAWSFWEPTHELNARLRLP